MEYIKSGEKHNHDMKQQIERENILDNHSKSNLNVGLNYDKYLPQFLLDDLNKISDEVDSNLTGEYEIHEVRETDGPLDFSEFEKCIEASIDENSLKYQFSSSSVPQMFLDFPSNKDSLIPPFKKKFHSNKEVNSYAKEFTLMSNSTLDTTDETMKNNYVNRNFIMSSNNNNINNSHLNKVHLTAGSSLKNFHYNNHSSGCLMQGQNDNCQFYNNNYLGNNMINNNYLKPERSYSNSYVNSSYINGVRNLNNSNYNIGPNRSNNPICNQNNYYFYNETGNDNSNNCYQFPNQNKIAKNSILEHNSLGCNYIQDNNKNNFQVNYSKNNEFVNNISSYNILNNINNQNNMINMNTVNRFPNFKPTNNNSMFNLSGFNDNLHNSDRNFYFDNKESNIIEFHSKRGTESLLEKLGGHLSNQNDITGKDMNSEENVRTNINGISTKVTTKTKKSSQSLFSGREKENNDNSDILRNSQQALPSVPLNSKKLKTSLFNSNTESGESTKSFIEFISNLKIDLHLFITTQKGSRTMQKYLNKISPENLDEILLKLKDHLAYIMTDIYGNYFCQRLIQCCSTEQRIFIIKNIQPDLSEIAMNASGTHSLQSLIEILNIQKEGDIILEGIKGIVSKLSLNANATHVIQKLIVCINESNRHTINNEILSNFDKLVKDSNGICVLKKFINNNSSLEFRNQFLDKIANNVLEIVQNPFGNYVVQFVLEDWGVEIAMNKILAPIISNVVSLSMQKFSSNVVEKCLLSSESLRKEIIQQLFNSSKIASLIKNKYGNFVLQKAIVLLNADYKRELKEDILRKIRVTSCKDKTRLNKLIEML